MEPAASGLTALTAAQAGLVGLPTEGQFLVRGAAGAGKTTVALARAAHLAKQPLLHGPPRVLLLARSPSLATEQRSRRDRLPAAVARRIEVDAAGSWCRRFLALGDAPVPMPPDVTRPPPLASSMPPLQPGEFELLVGFALAIVRRRYKRQVLRRPLAFFTSELSSMLLSLGIERYEEYQAVAREGRALPLDDESRKAVFEVFEETRALASRIGRALPLAPVPDALRRLAALRTPPYDHVVVDDAHLLAPVELRLVRALASGGSLTLFSALEQRFDPLAATLSALGLDRLDRTEVLPKSLRGPKAIYRVALQILRRRAGGNASDLRAIVPEAIDGPRPRLILAGDWRGELDALIDELRRFRGEGRAWREAAVLLPSAFECEFMAVALAAAGIATTRVVDESDDGATAAVDSTAIADAVQLCPLAAAYGREFPLVLVPDLNRGAWPRSRHELEEHERSAAMENAARNLHLALTRATEEAVLIATAATCSPLLPKKALVIERAPEEAGADHAIGLPPSIAPAGTEPGALPT
jgi:superfamily I DNA/RNA helicase